MKKFLQYILLVALLGSATVGSSQNQFLDYQMICWDSAGTITPLLKRIYDVPGMGRVTTYHDISTMNIVTPTVGTFNECRDTSTVHVIPGCYAYGTAVVDLTLADNGGQSHLIIKSKDGRLDTIGFGNPEFASGWTANLLRIVANGEGADLCTSGGWSNNGEILTITGYISDYDSLVVDTPRQSFPFVRTITEQFSIQIHKVLGKDGSIISETAYDPQGVLVAMCGVKVGECENTEDALLKYATTCVDNPDSLRIYTLFCPDGTRHPDSYSYGANFSYIGQIPAASGSTHPDGTTGNIDEWYIYAMCSDTLPGDDSGGHSWLLGNAESFSTVSFVRQNADPVCGTVNYALRTVSCDKVTLDSINTEIIANSLSNPTFPAGVDQIVIMNHSAAAYIQLTTNLGPQIVGPNASIYIENPNMTFVSISAVAGSFTTGDYLVFNYANNSP